jgi:glucose-fructose oxidoreductase
MTKHTVTRRDLLKAAAASAVAAPVVVRSTALGGEGKAPASERVTLGHIGVGGRGRAVLSGFRRCKDAQSVAVADCYDVRREGIAKELGGKGYRDFRELLARDDIDAVVVATPDHWHVPVAVAAARAGKDAYVEKPLGVSIEQDQICREVFKENKRVFQYGTQQRSMAHCRFGCELVRSGRVGQVHTIEVIAPDGGGGGSKQEAPVPEGLDYETWVGPAQWAPYAVGRCRPPGTYWIYDYSIGYLGGWGAHPLDIMVWGSDADQSGIVEIEGAGVITPEGLYDSVHHWDMKGKLGEVAFTFKPGGDSTKFIGPDGWVEVRRGGIDAEPKSLLSSEIKPDEVHLVDSPRQDQNFIDCVKSRKQAVSPLDEAVRSDVISHLCDIAVRLKRKVRWDPKKEIVLDDAEATRMLHRPMRAPWTLEG